MSKRFIILIILIWFNNIGFSQDFKFKWQIWTSIGKTYTVLIEKSGVKNYIVIKETGGNDSIRKVISQNDCDTLVSFLDKYDFPIKGSIAYGSKVREYYETKLLQDTNWIQINGDSLRIELIRLGGYYFDKDSNKYYTESQMMNVWTDGDIYEGYFIKSNKSKRYSIYCARISIMDFKLNNLIYNLMIKYNKKKDYIQLKNFIDYDQPRE